MNYDTNFLLTYNLHEDTLDNICYQQQFLQVFKLTEYNNNVITKTIQEIYNELSNLPDIKIVLNKIKQDTLNNIKINLFNNTLEDIDLFYYLFSYDYLHLFHKEYCNYKNNKIYNFINII